MKKLLIFLLFILSIILFACREKEPPMRCEHKDNYILYNNIYEYLAKNENDTAYYLLGKHLGYIDNHICYDVLIDNKNEELCN